jgi:hypothetical protein
MKAKICLMAVSVITAIFLGACSVNINGDRLDLDGSISYTEGTSLIEEENLAQNADGVKTLEIVNSAGNINITRSDSRDVAVKFTKKVKGTDENEKKKIMENIYLKMDENGDRLTISARSGDESGSYIWDWVSRLYKSANVTIDYDIKVPEGVKVYKIDNNAGNTAFDKVAGEIDIKQNAGEISLNEVSLEGDSSFNMNAGNINMDAVVDRADEVAVSGTAGNIGIKIPGASRIELETRLMAGKLSGSFLSGTSIKSGTFRQEFNGGGTRLLVTLTAGNVIIDAK